MALSGTFYGTTSNQYIKPKIVWSATQSISGNSSTVTATLYYSRTNTGYTTTGNGTFTITINGSSYTLKKRVTLTYNSNTQAVAYTANVAHNADGSKSITIKATGSISGTTLTSTSISSTVTLDTIPRATQPSLSSSSVNMGSAVTISTPRASSSFTHDLAYSFRGGAYVSIATGVGTSYSWTVPDLASSIPSATSGSMTIRCITKNGSTTIGTKTVSLTAKVPSSVVPTISSVAVAEATSGLAAQFGAYIQSKSKLSVTITAAGAKGSTIKSYRTTFSGKTYTARTWTSDILAASGTLSMTTTVTDSRGRTASKTTSVSVLAYTPPRIQAFSVYRCNSEGAADDEGLYIAVRYKYSAPSLNGGNTASLAAQYKQSTATSYSSLLSGSGLSADMTEKPSSPTFSTDYQYDLLLTVTDYFGAVATAEAKLPSGKVILDLAADGLGFAVGKTSERDGLEVAWPLNTKEIVICDGTLYPSVDYKADFDGPVKAQVLANMERNIVYFRNWCTDSGYYENYLTPDPDTGRTKNGSYKILTTKDATDYVVAQGTSGGWLYQKWSSGKAVCSRTISNTPTVISGANSVTVTLPFSFASTSYTVQITKAANGFLVTDVIDANGAQNSGHTAGSFIVTYKYSSGTVYPVSFNVSVAGSWK